MERIRLGSLTKWHKIPEGDCLHFPGRNTRTVQIEVNSEAKIAYFVGLDEQACERTAKAIEDEEAGRVRPALPDGLYFVGGVEGRGIIEFSVTGEFDLVPVGGDSYVYSHERLRSASRTIAPVIYTRIANRRARNPHQEMMEYQLKLNQSRFLEMLAEEQERRLNDLETRYARDRNIRTPPALIGKQAGAGLGKGGALPEDGAGDGDSPEDGEGDGVPARGKAAKPPRKPQGEA